MPMAEKAVDSITLAPTEKRIMRARQTPSDNFLDLPEGTDAMLRPIYDVVRYETLDDIAQSQLRFTAALGQSTSLSLQRWVLKL